MVLDQSVGVTCSPHRLRRTAATLMLAATGEVATVSRTLGHSSVAITARANAFVVDDAQAATVGALGAGLAARLTG